MPSPKILPVGSDESIVISGISGRFPQSDNLGELARNLYEKRDLVDDSEVRFKHTMPDVPRRAGKINNLTKFDREFFGYDRRQRDTMDPQQRMLIEHTYEAILDAGVNPESLRGSRTGVFSGLCFSETEVRMYYVSCPPDGLGVLGSAKSQLANRVSYTMDFRGPSMVMDTACSSSMYALDIAYRSIKNGECDAAIVMGSNLTLHPFITYQFALLGVLAKDGYCRPFDKKGSGYTRAEAACSVFLQKAKDAKRVYGHLLHSKTNCDGFKSEGITYPSGVVQQQLLSEFYSEVGINPIKVNYVEAHSTGTMVGDPEECDALDKVYCTGRTGPLLVGSVKSSIGHSEAAAGVCSIAKCIITLENGLIPPNINFEENKPSILSLVEGRLKVVDEVTPLPGPLVGINSFGFGGANAHALLFRNSKEKKQLGLPADELPRLVVWSGRTKEAVEVMLRDIAERPLDSEFIALLYNIQKQAIPGHRYRGYGIYRKNGEKPAILHESNIARIQLEPLPLVAIFGGINRRWRLELEELRQFTQVEATLAKCHGVFQTLKFDMFKKHTGKEPILNSMVGTVVLQLALVDLLNSIGVKFDFYGGHSVGQFTCAYLDRNLSLEQVIRVVFWHGLVYTESKAVGDCSIFVKINNKLDQVILKGMVKNASSGFGVIAASNQTAFEQIRQLNSAGYVAEELAFTILSSEPPIESSISNKLRQTMNTVLSRAVIPTSKWFNARLSQPSSIFHTPKLHNSVSIVNLLDRIPKNAHILELGSSQSCEKVLNILNYKSNYLPRGLDSSDAVNRLLSRIGRLHLITQNLQIAKLYPAVQFPVSRGTTMISPLLRWDHREDAHVVRYGWDETSKSNILDFKITLTDEDYKYIVGHSIDGRVLFPATGYLLLVWDLLAHLSHCELLHFSIEFEDLQFLRATTIAKGQTVNLIVSYQAASGYFEILEGVTAVVTGYARSHDSSAKEEIIEEVSTATMMQTRDFYKELRLRGYHYSGLFKSVLETRVDGSEAKIEWKGSWVALMDCILQVGIVAVDTRSLMVPTAIEKVVICPKDHLQALKKDDQGREYLDVRCCTRTNVSVCGGIVISNPRVNIIGRRNPPGVPILETYQFIPYRSDGPVSSLEAIRMCVQLALENVPMLSVAVTEVHSDGLPVLSHLFGEAIADLPLVQSSLTLLTAKPIEVNNAVLKNEKLSDQTNSLFLISDNKLTEASFLKDAKSCLVDVGFLLIREAAKFDTNAFRPPSEFNLIATFRIDQEETFILLQCNSRSLSETPAAIQVQMKEFSWLTELKKAVKFRPVILYAQNDSISGIIGLVNCIRKEPKLQNVRCVFVDDSNAPPFALNDPFYQNQLNLGLAVNVFKHGKWGSYRHALLTNARKTESVTNHCYANGLVKGDLSSMMWFTGPMNECSSVSNKVRVVYSALNFRDVMVATGRLSSDVLASKRLDEECELGCEFAGVLEDGRRVMGITSGGGLATLVNCDPLLTYPVPDGWTMEEACTIPVVYGTVCIAFYMCIQIQKGKSVLIHAGSGGVGQAAIQVALAEGLKVFTTVSTEEKKQFLLEKFPELKRENIGNSRDTSFEQMIKIRTNGKGVDYVLNSLAEEKLQASIRCLGKGGHFLEIGKYDMARNSKIAMSVMQKGLTFTSVMLDLMFNESRDYKLAYHQRMIRFLGSGIVRPLNRTVFDAVDVEQAMRFLASGKHMGKILLKIRENETDLDTLPIQYVPRVYCNPEQVHVVIGGLGGFGLELADWLIIRGCRRVVLSSSRGITKSYQEYRIKMWRNYGVQVLVCTANIATLDGCRMLLRKASELGTVSAIYNLAVQLRDAILDNQTPEMYGECFAPKANATEYLDVVSRELCPQLKQFVVFSSVSCGRGNAGQSNYGMANSIMERIIERRHAQGLPAKAIQWGAIGEVGLVADMAEDRVDMEIGGTLQQRISSCLQELDRLLTCEEPIVASMVVAEKRVGGASKNIIEAVMNIMSIRELKSVSMESTLADIGMDSLMAVEIKQVLERDFELVLSTQELRTLTFLKLLKLDEQRKQDELDKDSKGKVEVVVGVQMLLRNLGDETNSDTTILRLPSSGVQDEGRPVLIIPGLEGVAGNVWYTIAEKLNTPVFILQLMSTLECDSIPDMVDCVIEELCDVFSFHDSYAIVGYSFGSLITVEVAKRLRARGMHGKLLLLDGAPKFMKLLVLQQMGDNPEEFQKKLMFLIISFVIPNQPVEKILSIMQTPSFDEGIDKLIDLANDQHVYSPNYTRKMAKALLRRIRMTAQLDLEEDQPLNLPITLVRPTDVSFADIESDYGLSNCTTGSITLHTIEGSHITMLENPALVEIINNFIL
ncbi:fatty acid synthase-like [Topomyia yanbarensis]|uniref:fatty acid synthase-like n=1 Tax=Topomyia yanbarensis TaxID=2498891 RepID=UPI00273AC664|nr:fatty acid synthase-like [Topomyia yanbarensis]